MAKEKAFTIQQLTFINKYLESGNATKSYLEAGYKAKNENVAGASAHKLLRTPKIHAYITEERERLRREGKVSRDDLLAKNAQIAFSNINEVVHVVNGALEFKSDDVDLNIFDNISCSKSESSSTTKDGGSDSSSISISIKRSDRLKALDAIGKLIGAYESDDTDGSRDLAGTAARILSAIGRVRPK